MARRPARPPLRQVVARLPRHRAFWITLWTAAALAELAVLSRVLVGGGAPVDPVQIVFSMVGGSFAACGLIAWRRRPDSRVGLLMTATGFAFFASPLLGMLDSAIAQTAALLLPDLWFLPFVALLMTFLTGGRLRTRVDRILVGAVVVQLVVLAPLFLLVSPEYPSLLLVRPDEQLAAVVDTAQRAFYLAITLATTGVIAARWVAASPPRRRAMMPSVAGTACLLLFSALLLVDLIAPERSRVLLWAAACSIVAVPLAFLGGLLRSRLSRGVLADLFGSLATMRPDELQIALSRTLGDPRFLIAYPAEDGGYLDPAGHPVTLPDPGSDRSVSRVQRDGQPVAALVYDRILDEDPELIEAVGGAATIAMDNSRLQAEAQARLAELRSSRERIIAAADAERRRIERNLHDGAQQRLVTLAMQLSLIQRRIRDDPADAELLVTSASDELAASLEELRALARGIHPAALDQGLRRALDALALRSAVPTTVSGELPARMPEPVEFAAYYVASEALANTAKYARATAARIRVTSSGRETVIEVTDDGIGGADPSRGSGLRGLADRVDALGGRFRVASPPHGGTTVTAELPHPESV
jgi:signal transduction histidine kinase